MTNVMELSTADRKMTQHLQDTTLSYLITCCK